MISIQCYYLVSEQGTVALWSNAPALDRKIEGSNLAANSFASERPSTRETTNWKRKTRKGAPADDH